MKQTRGTLIVKAALLVSMLAVSAAATAASQDKKSKSAAPEGAPVIILMPLLVASDDKLGNGCWARLYERDNYKGNMLTLVGPVDMPNMRTAFGTDWGGEFDSILVGPKATLTVYDNQNYKEKFSTFKPAQRVPDLDNKIGLFQDIRSLKIACGK